MEISVRELREKLRESCADCETCDVSEADVPTDEQLQRVIDEDGDLEFANAAWYAHLYEMISGPRISDD